MTVTQRTDYYLAQGLPLGQAIALAVQIPAQREPQLYREVPASAGSTRIAHV